MSDEVKTHTQVVRFPYGMPGVSRSPFVIGLVKAGVIPAHCTRCVIDIGLDVITVTATTFADERINDLTSFDLGKKIS